MQGLGAYEVAVLVEGVAAEAQSAEFCPGEPRLAPWVFRGMTWPATVLMELVDHDQFEVCWQRDFPQQGP